MKRILSILFFSILITSCHQKQPDIVADAVAEMNMEMIPATQQAPNAPPLIDKIEKQEVIKKKIIKDGSLGLRVSELEKTKRWIDSLIRNHGGYAANESFNNTDFESSFILKIRIPCSNFEKFIAEIETGHGEIIYKQIDARDVTDQFIDLETRLENKRNYLIRYNDLLKKANSVREILEIEEKIRGLEEEIESTTGRLKYLNDLVDYSTLDLTLSKLKDFKYNPAKRDKFSERVKLSLSKGWYGFIDLILVIINIWPFWIIIAMIIFFWKKYKKTKKKAN